MAGGKRGALCRVRDHTVALGLSLTLNCVLHRQNLASVPALIELALELGADRLELANTQYHGWAYLNRGALMPTRDQLDRASEAVRGAEERAKAAGLTMLFVRPDYFTDRPKPCMGGWGRLAMVVDPTGCVLPCHDAVTIPGLEFWNVREHLPEGNRRTGSVSSNDISLPLGVLPDFLAEAPALVARHGDFLINCFGHLGDGNLHYNLFPAPGKTRADYANVKTAVTGALLDLVVAMGGSYSAEHGIGRAKVDELVRYGDPAKLTAMRAIKAALDPVGIMNPGAVLA